MAIPRHRRRASVPKRRPLSQPLFQTIRTKSVAAKIRNSQNVKTLTKARDDAVGKEFLIGGSDFVTPAPPPQEFL